MRTFWLSSHVSYACRDSGACCSSGWDIPLETSRVAAIGRAIDRGTIAVYGPWLRTVEHAPADVAGVIALTPAGGCLFHQSPGCAIHAALGHDAIPASCQHFPRVCLIDSRGVFVTLSHFCPTAAALLFEPQDAVTIVEGPSALPGGAWPEGLDARESLPPSRSARMLMDLDEYAAWERHMVQVLTSGGAPEVALDLLEQGAREASVMGPASFSPIVKGPASFPKKGAGPVTHAITNPGKGAGPITNADLFRVAREAVPAPYTWPDAADEGWHAVEAEWSRSSAIIGRFLAAHAFASWMAYQGNGLAAQVLSLRQALAVLRVETTRHRSLLEGIRHADLLLRHLADRQLLASGLSALAA